MREIINDDASASHLYCFLLNCNAALCACGARAPVKSRCSTGGHSSPPRGMSSSGAALPVASGAVSSKGLAFSLIVKNPNLI